MTMQLFDNKYSNWINRYNTPRSRQKAQTVLNAFTDFVKTEYRTKEDKPKFRMVEFIDRMQVATPEKRLEQIERFVNQWIGSGLQTSTIKTYLVFLRDFLYTEKCPISDKELLRRLKLAKPLKESREPLTLDQISKLLSYARPEARAFFLCQLSSGCRAGELTLLKKEDIDTSQFPVKLRIRAENTKGKQERFTFISNQAWELVKPLYEMSGYGDNVEQTLSKMYEGYHADTRVRHRGFIFPFTLDMIELTMKDLRIKSGLLEKYVSTGYYKVNTHSFRATCRTVLSDKVNDSFAFFLLGQTGGYLNQYYRKTVDEARELYKKAESFLTVENLN